MLSTATGMWYCSSFGCSLTVKLSILGSLQPTSSANEFSQLQQLHWTNPSLFRGQYSATSFGQSLPRPLSRGHSPGNAVSIRHRSNILLLTYCTNGHSVIRSHCRGPEVPRYGPSNCRHRCIKPAQVTCLVWRYQLQRRGECKNWDLILSTFTRCIVPMQQSRSNFKLQS